MAPAASIAHRVNGERLVVLGWGRAILMQMAHPLIAEGVIRHSGFRETPIASVRRLHGTVRAMLSLTFGDEAERGRAAAGIRRIHDRVQGLLPHDAGRFEAGTRYSAHDPDLLLWVHVTLIDSTLRFYEDLVAPLTPAERDAYVSESSASVASLGLPATCAPRTLAAARAMLDDTLRSDRLSVGQEARAIAAAILRPAWSGLVLPVAAMQRLLTVGTLPPSLRDSYGFTWTPSQERRLVAVRQLLRGLHVVSPALLTRFAAARRAHTHAG
jgi:uncharacterized protein (DUF2236 family)